MNKQDSEKKPLALMAPSPAHHDKQLRKAGMEILQPQVSASPKVDGAERTGAFITQEPTFLPPSVPDV